MIVVLTICYCIIVHGNNYGVSGKYIVRCNIYSIKFKTFVCILNFTDAQNSFYAHTTYKKKCITLKRIPQAREISFFAVTPSSVWMTCSQGGRVYYTGHRPPSWMELFQPVQKFWIRHLRRCWKTFGEWSRRQRLWYQVRFWY